MDGHTVSKGKSPREPGEKRQREGRARVGAGGQRNARKRQKNRERKRGERCKQPNSKREKVIQAHELTSDICQREMGCTPYRKPGRSSQGGRQEWWGAGVRRRLNTDSAGDTSDRTSPGPSLRPAPKVFWLRHQ